MNSSPSLNVEEIMDAIRQEVDKRKLEIYENNKKRFIEQHLFDIDDFCQNEDEEFICNAYLGILNREVEETALRDRLKELTDGTKTKEDLLFEILSSEEAEKNRINILRINKPDEIALERVNFILKSWGDEVGEKIRIDEQVFFDKNELRRKSEAVGLNAQNLYKINDFIKYNDEAFVNYAYKYILGRAPDPTGKALNLEILRSGKMTKIDILCNLRFSKEGKNRKLNIAGLRKYHLYQIVSNVPIIGNLIRTINTLVKLPSLLTHINKLESDCNRLTEESLQLIHSNEVLFKQSSKFEIEINNRIKKNEVVNDRRINSLIINMDLAKKAIVENSEIIDIKANEIDIKLLYQFSGKYLISNDVEAKKEFIELSKKITETILEIKNNIILLADKAEKTELEIKDNLAMLSDKRDSEIKVNIIALTDKMNKFEVEAKKITSELTERIGQAELELNDDLISLADKVRLDTDILTEKISQCELKPDLQSIIKFRAEDFVGKGIRLSKHHLKESNYRSENLYYSIFEDVFYESKAVKNKQKIYIDYINKLAHVKQIHLDIGCGRGEFLEILIDNKLKYIGIDINKTEITRLIELSFNVFKKDIFNLFSETESEEFSSITAFQVIEHITSEKVKLFIENAYRVLQKDGVFIVETVNPHSYYAFGGFYMDDTHVKPIPPEQLIFMMQWYGFKDVELVYSSLLPDEYWVNETKRNYYDYALVGYKR